MPANPIPLAALAMLLHCDDVYLPTDGWATAPPCLPAATCLTTCLDHCCWTNVTCLEQDSIGVTCLPQEMGINKWDKYSHVCNINRHIWDAYSYIREIRREHVYLTQDTDITGWRRGGGGKDVVESRIL